MISKCYRKHKKKYRGKWPIITFITLLLLVSASVAWWFNLFPGRYYDAEHFGIETLMSPNDANNNRVDDFTDIVFGARLEAKAQPKYDGAYWNGGYPPDDIGVCADTIWRAFKYAGYNLKSLVDEDIAANFELYPGLNASGIDPNIDFRRVRNLNIFFSRHAQSLTLDISDIAQWMPGDIVVFSSGDHIAICSDRRNTKGIPWLIHNGGQPQREEDALEKLLLYKTLIGHYRWVD